jgi:hypothetical protein
LHCAPSGERLAVNLYFSSLLLRGRSATGAVQLKGWGWGDRRYGGYFCTITKAYFTIKMHNYLSNYEKLIYITAIN